MIEGPMRWVILALLLTLMALFASCTTDIYI